MAVEQAQAYVSVLIHLIKLEYFKYSGGAMDATATPMAATTTANVRQDSVKPTASMEVAELEVPSSKEASHLDRMEAANKKVALKVNNSVKRQPKMPSVLPIYSRE